MLEKIRGIFKKKHNYKRILTVGLNVIDFVLMEGFGHVCFSGYNNPFSS